MAFADTLRAVNAMKSEGVIEEYAIAGAMAVVFWAEPVPGRQAWRVGGPAR